MTVSTETRIAGPFAGDGVTTAFPFTFFITSPTHVGAVGRVNGVYTEYTYGTHFTVTLNPNQDVAPGGTVTFLVAPATGTDIVLVSRAPYTQTTDIQNQGGFFPETIERALDRIVVQTQQLRDEVERSVRALPGGGPLNPIEVKPGKFFATDASGQPIMSSGTGADLGLREDLVEPTGASLINTRRTGGTTRSVQSKLRDRFDLRDFGVVNRSATTNEYTAEIQAALAQAKAEGVTTVYCEESYRVAGTITIPSGLALVSAGGSTSYYDPLNYPQSPAPGLYKPSDGLNGPVLIRGIGDTLIGLTLEHQKVGGATVALGGVMQMGQALPSNNANNCTTYRVTVIGHEIDYEPNGTRLRRTFGSGTPDCALVVFPATPIGTQRYHHIVHGLRLSNAWIGIWMGNQANANQLTGVVTGAIWRPIWLDGAGGEVLGNVFEGQWVGNYPLPTTVYTAETIPPADLAASQAGLKLLTTRNLVRYNIVSGYMETGGATVDADATSAAAPNDLSGLWDNWTYTSAIPDAWQAPRRLFNPNRRKGDYIVLVPYASDYTPTLAIRDAQGFGAKVEKRKIYTVNLPLADGGTFGVNNQSRVFARWNQLGFVSKGARPTLRGKLRVQVNCFGGGAGVHTTEVEFEYRTVDNATQAGELSVISVRRSPTSGNYIGSLVFITGLTTTVRPFAFGLSLGNFVASPPSHVFVSLEFEATTHGQNIVPMGVYADMTLEMEDVVAADVTDAISMLTVGTTAV